MDKVIEKNISYLYIHIVPKDAVNDACACDIDCRSDLQIDLMCYMSLGTMQITSMSEDLSDSMLNELSLITQDKKFSENFSVSFF